MARSASVKPSMAARVAKAVLTALAVEASGKARGAVALPSNRHHHVRIAKVKTARQSVGVGVFWVDDEQNVTEEGPWLYEIKP